MASALAVVSKAQFEAAIKGLGRKELREGDVWPVDQYLSTHRRLDVLAGGGSLFLVTVRPPDERLWLVAVLESPKRQKDGWHGAPNTAPARDITSLQIQLRFASGKGLSARPGALGMSLQTPRELHEADVVLLQRGQTHQDRTAASSPPPTPSSWSALVRDLALGRWTTLSADRRRAILEEVAGRFAPALVLLEPGEAGDIGRFKHVGTGAVFHLIPGGLFELGLTQREVHRLQELAPDDAEDADVAVEMAAEFRADAVEIDVAPFLLAAEPLSSEQLALLLESDEAVTEECCFNPNYAKKAATALDGRGLRVPSEAEWEYACRAGTRALFPGGQDVLPSEPSWPVNGFGLARMGELPELCADGWHGSRTGGPADARAWAGDDGAVRGGSAMLWPWQGPDWALSLCGLRQSLSSQEFFLALRPAMSLAPEEALYHSEVCAARRGHGHVRREPPPPKEETAIANEASASACVITNMYGKALGDLGELTSPGLTEADAETLLMRIRERRVAGAGSYYSGETVEQVPFILDLLQRDVPARGALSLLALDLILGGHESKLPALDWKHLGVSQVAPCFAALKSGKAVLLDVLQHAPSPEARSGVVLLVAPTWQGEEGAQLLASCLKTEQDAAVRASLAIGIGVAGWGAREAERAKLRGLLVELLNASALERAAAGLSLGTLDRGETIDPVMAVLEELAYHPSVSNAAHFRWCLGDLRAFALQVAEAVGPHATAAVTSGVLRRIRELARQKKGKREASTCANLLLALHFRYRSKPTDTDGWSTYQHSLARALSADGAPEARWDERGMPVDLAERRKSLRMT